MSTLVYRVAWKPIAADLSIPSARIRCLNVIQHFHSDLVRLELFNPKHFPDDYDAVIFSKKTTDENLAQAREMKARGKKVFFDICDNQFFDRVTAVGTNDEQERRLREMFALSDYITTTNETLKTVFMEYAPADKIVILEDALEEKIYIESHAMLLKLRARFDRFCYQRWLAKHAGKIKLIWFGTVGDKKLGTGLFDILRKREWLEQTQYRDRIVLTICSNSATMFKRYFSDWKIPVRFMKWNANHFYPVLQANDVALIPVTPNPLTLCKSNNRVITALYNNLVVIADGIPSYQEFSDAIVLDDWEAGLARFSDPIERKRSNAIGMRIIQEKYMPRVIAGKWARFLETAMTGQG